MIEAEKGTPLHDANVRTEADRLAGAGDPVGAARLLARTADDAHRAGRYEEAMPLYAKAVELDPGNVAAANNLGLALDYLGQHAEAVACFTAILSRKPGHIPALTNRGNAAWNAGGDDAASLTDHRQAATLSPGDPALHMNLGYVLHLSGRYEEALAAYDRALELDPALASARHDRGQLLLHLGRLPEGFRDYEWRWRPESGHAPAVPNFPCPVWKGTPGTSLPGRLLVLAEQGFGDVIQFCRYIPLLAEHGHDVVFAVDVALYRLMAHALTSRRITVVLMPASSRRAPWWLRLAVRGLRMPSAVAKVGLLSLPDRFSTSADSVPAAVPYLSAPPKLVRQWRERLAQPEGKLRIGLVWEGKRLKGRQRSIPATALHPLIAATPDAQFFALQAGPAGRHDFPFPNVTRLGEQLGDFCETAAVMMNLDLVITIDTSTAHLAGALGIPVWVMVMKVPDWRWGITGGRTSWYPTARLFRQTTRNDWEPVVAELAGALRQAVSDPQGLNRPGADRV